jgi:diguanylate cyclase (GGDEF)-like protein
VIQKLADVCSAVAARSNDVVARLGGEEFAVLLPDTNAEDALRLAEKIRSEVQVVRIVGPDGSEFGMTVSIGVAQARSTDSIDLDFISRADKALYEAKNSGRNRVVLAALV